MRRPAASSPRPPRRCRRSSAASRNWDYRYCWLRDATLTLLGAMHAGYFEEAQAWREWLLRAVAGSPDQLQIMYGIGGERRLTEWDVPGCPATRIPRRCASAMPPTASSSSTSSARSWTCITRRAAAACRPTNPGWAAQRAFLDHLEQIWSEPDEGIWEVRGDRRSTSLIPRSWPGWRSIARSRARRHSGWRGRSTNGASCARRFTTRFARSASTRSRQLRPVLRIEAARRQLLMLPIVGFLPASDPRVKADCRGDRAAAAARRLRDALRHRPRSTTACRPAKARSSPAASGWPTSIRCRVALPTPSGCFAGSSGCATTSGY